MNTELESVLLRSGAITSHALERSVGLAHARNVPLWELLVVDRQLPEETLADAFATCLDVPRLHLDAIVVEAIVLKLVAVRLARKHTCMPVRLQGKVLVVAMANPLDRQAIENIEFIASREVRAVVACRSEIIRSIDRHYGSETGRIGGAGESAGATGSEFDSVEAPRPQARPGGDPPVAVELCTRIIRDAVALGASDIHVEPGVVEMCVRLRVDGMLRDHLRLPGWMHAALLSRVKVLAKLDITQQRLPQDGRIRVVEGGRDVDLRVSTLPTHLGEKAVLRVLGAGEIPPLDRLGLAGGEIARLDTALHQPQGLILVTGPTGAGKSTTLYSMLTRRHSPEVNVVTIEDPIEYQVAGASQVQVDAKSGLTFAGSLRAILRQDPDVILVGEIRDAETAEIAFQAALTGHLVLTTLHTNDSVGALERLLDLGVTPLLLASAANLIVAQRLARRICAECVEPYTPSPDLLARLFLKPGGIEFRRGRGCAACAHTGYAGRVGIFEILRVTDRVRDLVAQGARASEIRGAAWAAGTRFLMEDALAKVRQGLTTIEEILRVIRIERRDEDPIADRARLSAADDDE
jgi:type IV pilus assembly protein PilB